MNNDNWYDVIAEEPVDAMGSEFANTFRAWVRDNKPMFNGLWSRAFDLFQKRLDLAIKFKTYFAEQMTKDGHEVWRERFNGEGFDPCYSYAIKGLERTKRFYEWADAIDLPQRDASIGRHDVELSVREWDEDYAPFPHLPNGENGPIVPYAEMSVVSFIYRPVFAAKKGGVVKMRRIKYGRNCFLFEHVRNVWVPLMRDEAEAWWNKAIKDGDRRALAAWEWCWFWTNPFGRSAALSGDALSLIVQKHHNFHMRTDFYHQDCEALLMPFEDYVTKREMDLLHGFEGQFKMKA